MADAPVSEAGDPLWSCEFESRPEHQHHVTVVEWQTHQLEELALVTGRGSSSLPGDTMRG